MNAEQILAEIQRREYYRRQEQKNEEMMDCAWFAFQIGVIACCLLSIAGHVRELWMAF